ncbi:hypothetical protein LNA02_06680 [Levilactobacillus namurensis]|nr:hypothetical protein LNA02_06680 [Levilactobacillus namurensis]
MLFMVSPETTSVALEMSMDGNDEFSIQLSSWSFAELVLLDDEPQAARSTAAKDATVPNLTADLIFIVKSNPSYLGCVS